MKVIYKCLKCPASASGSSANTNLTKPTEKKKKGDHFSLYGFTCAATIFSAVTVQCLFIEEVQFDECVF